MRRWDDVPSLLRLGSASFTTNGTNPAVTSLRDRSPDIESSSMPCNASRGGRRFASRVKLEKVLDGSLESQHLQRKAVV